MKTHTVRFSTLTTTRRMDARYNGAVVDHLKEIGLEETPENVQLAMQQLRDRDVATKAKASELREQAAALIDQARDLDEEASLTFPVRR